MQGFANSGKEWGRLTFGGGNKNLVRGFFQGGMSKLLAGGGGRLPPSPQVGKTLLCEIHQCP